jgi:hypothetical protein
VAIAVIVAKADSMEGLVKISKKMEMSFLIIITTSIPKYSA